MGIKFGNKNIKDVYYGNKKIKKIYYGSILVYPSFAPGDDFTDTRDGNVYKTIIINGKTWLAENLRYLPYVFPTAEYTRFHERTYVYDYDGTDVATAKATSNYSTYGVLYNYMAATNLIPAGWHIPTNAELYELENFFATGLCEIARSGYGCPPAGTALQEGGVSKFNFLLGGFSNNGFFELGNRGNIWGQDAVDANAICRLVYDGDDRVSSLYQNQANGFSLRLIKD